MNDSLTDIKRKIFSGGAWAFAGKVLASLLGIAVNGLLARLLTPEEMGAYFLTLSLVSVATIFAQLGLSRTIVRLIAESVGSGRAGRAKDVVQKTFFILTITSVFTASFFVFGGGARVAAQIFHSALMAQIMGGAALWIVVAVFQGVIAEMFRGFHDIRLATVFDRLSTGLFSMVLFAALWALQGHGSLRLVVILTVVAGLSSVFFSSLILRKRVKQLPLQAEVIAFSEIFTIAWPLWITNITLFALTQADLWILGIFRPQGEVAIYGAAARLTALVTMPLLIVNAVMPPVIAEMNVQGRVKELEKVFRITATVAAIPSLLVLVMFFLGGDVILALLFGDYYRQGGLVLTILGFGQLINVWSGSCGLALTLTGYQVTMMLITMSCGIVMVTGAVLLVPQFGSTGVASAASAGMVLQNILMVFFAQRRLGVWTHLNPKLLFDIVKQKWHTA